MTAERVIVVGDAVLDVLARPDAPLVPAADVPATVRLRPGGQGANVAVRLARRGLPVRLVTALADDAAGQLLRGLLSDEGIELAALPVEASGSVVVLIDAAGERTMLSQRAPFAHLVGRDAVDGAARWVVVSGYLLLEPEAPHLVRHLAGLSTPVVVLGCALPNSTGADRWRRLVQDAAPALVAVNAAEAAALVDPRSSSGPTQDEASLAAALAGSIGAPVVVTGPAGAAAAGADGGDARVPSAPGAGPAIDSTGAGDAFAAALIASLGRGQDVATALAQGMTLAASVARVVGAQTRVADEPGGTLDR